MLRRWRERRLENVEAKLRDWQDELYWAQRQGANRRELGCRRAIARLEKRIARLRGKLDLEESDA